MSGLLDSPSEGGSSKSIDYPRAVVHKKILEVAADDPDASIEELAALVSGASVSLVDRVLDEYGDPAGESTPLGGQTSLTSPTTTDSLASTESVESRSTEQTTESGLSMETDSTATADEPEQEPQSTPESLPDPMTFTEKQRRTLRAIQAHPDATQAELAEILDVSPPTVSKRVNDLPGFEWQVRRSYVEQLFDDERGDHAVEPNEFETGDRPAENSTELSTPPPETTSIEEDVLSNAADEGISAETAAEIAETLDGLKCQVAALEERVDEQLTAQEAIDSAERDGDGAFSEPELVHKMVHACMTSERITEDEEFRILEEVLG